MTPGLKPFTVLVNLCCLRKLGNIYLLNNIIFFQRYSHTYTAEETNSITRCIHRLPKDLLGTVKLFNPRNFLIVNMGHVNWHDGLRLQKKF